SDLMDKLLNSRILPVNASDIREISHESCPASHCCTRKWPPLSRCPRIPQPKLTSLNKVPSILAILRATGSITTTPFIPTNTCSTREGGWYPGWARNLKRTSRIGGCPNPAEPSSSPS